MAQGRGFTLVELLVVIGIIAVLVALLFPMLNRSREHSRRAVCLSNLRQLGLAFNLYANAFREQIPLGEMKGITASAGEYQWNYNIYFVDATRAFSTQMGVLLQSNFLDAPRTFYCPSETNAQWMFQTPENPFPVKVPTPSPIGTHTRIGYGTRPGWSWVVDGRWPKPMARISKMKSQAIAADLVCAPAYVLNRHKDGINVLYGDGSAHWVQRVFFRNPTWDKIPFDNWGIHNNPALMDLTKTPPAGVWPELDRH